MTARPSSLPRLVAAGLLAFGLSGCISLLPKQKSAMLYRFGGQPPAIAPAAETAVPVGVFRAGGVFQQEAASDRILTITGERAAYIARARWVAPADVLFEQAVTGAFDAAGGRVRLVARGDPAKADYSLRLDVRNFETHYAGETPTVLVRVHAVLLHAANRSDIKETVFEATVPASENRVGAIVSAYDHAVAQVLKDLVPWVEGGVG
jgi:cholesterol transport system auxiliary component